MPYAANLEKLGLAERRRRDRGGEGRSLQDLEPWRSTSPIDGQRRASSLRRWRGGSPKRRGSISPRCQGSGPHGRIIERDVKAALAPAARAKRAAEAEAPLRRSPKRPPPRRRRSSTRSTPTRKSRTNSMRKAIARRLTESIQTIPHFYLDVDCEIDALLRLREEFNAAAPSGADGKPEWKISVNDLHRQGAGAGLAARAGRQCDLHAGGDAETQSLGHRRRGGDSRRPDHADHSQRAGEVACARFPTRSGNSPAARASASSSRRNMRAASSAVSNLGMYGIRQFLGRDQSAAVDDPRGRRRASSAWS